MPSKLEWVGTCVGLREQDLNDYDDTEREIGYATFLKHLGRERMRELNEQLGYRRGEKLQIGTDWHITFSRGKWKGKPAICMMWSSIHHLWKILPNDSPRNDGRRSSAQTRRSLSIASDESW